MQSGALVSIAAIAFAAALQAQPTYSREVSRLFQAKCQQCHRNGDIAPFALDSYEAAVTWGADIKRVVEERIMPPWKPVPGHGDFRDNFSLTEEERRTILDWIGAEMPEGVKEDLPEPLPETGDWQLGPPDLVLEMPEFEVPRARDLYRCFVLPTNFDDTRFVTAAQSLPGNKQIVHHVILFIDRNGASEKLDGQDGYPGYNCFGGPLFSLGIGDMLGGWVPGLRERHLPEGIGIALPAKARIVMQVHYFPNGRPGPDKTRVGLYFSSKPVERRLIYVPILNDTFTVPPGAENHEVKQEYQVPLFLDAKLITIAPHMHLIGTRIQVEAEIPRRGIEPLILIDKWDFNWQNFYTYTRQIALPSFSKVRLRCTYDNSENNPRNPNNPLKPISWGEGTEDEMCLAFLGVTFDLENLLPFQRPWR